MPIAVLTQAVISAISIPTEADNINIYLKDGELVSISRKELKEKKSTNELIVYKRDKELVEIKASDIDYIRYESLDTYDKTVDFVKEYNIMVNDLDEHVLNYYNTKRYKKSRTSQTLAVAGWTLAIVANPLFWAVAPIPTTQAIMTMRSANKKYVVGGKEWKEVKKAQKAKIKELKQKAKEEQSS
ncbi:hypothetical protein EI427_21545 [Flammeovirga pectinis]|uniref:Uncharacterized protein n=1 Tax=Flammeovirga pectinis TaxID=2494373 RepID=A0A3S9P9Q1_9BACT|nr:hypothetical protein [Flammeovirga pectinis]AZQ64812.1 hypothetical protein EI427_21545 [Flammeovirga pectinis]